MLVAAGIEDQCSPDLAAGILECELVELLVEVCYGLGTESAQERASTDEPYGWVSMMYKVPTNGGRAAYCSIAIVACNRASSGHNSFGSVGDSRANGLKIGVEATLKYGYFGIIFDVLRQFSRAADIERQRMIVRQCLAHKVDARLAWRLADISRSNKIGFASRMDTCRSNHKYMHLPLSLC